MNSGIGIDLPNARFDRREFVVYNQIGLVEHHDIGEGQLFLRFMSAIDLAQEMLGVDNRDNGVELGLPADIRAQISLPMAEPDSLHINRP